MQNENAKGFQEFFDSYIECALWASTDENGNPLDDNYYPDQITAKTLEVMETECKGFYEANSNLWEGLETYSDAQAGHDFWLTRNGHGAGFWDRGLGTIGLQLTEIAKIYGSFDLYVGDEKLIHGM